MAAGTAETYDALTREWREDHYRHKARELHLLDELRMAQSARVVAESRLETLRQILTDLRAGRPGAEARADWYLEAAGS